MHGNYEKCNSYGYDCDVQWVTDDAKRIYIHVNTNNKLKHEMKTNEEDDGDDDDGEQRKKEKSETKRRTGLKERKRTSKQANEQQSLPSASHKNLGLVK